MGLNCTRIIAGSLLHAPPSYSKANLGNFYLLKIEAKSFRDGSQDICKDTESNLGPFAGFQGGNYPEESFISVSVLNNSQRMIMNSALFFLSFSFLACQGHFFI